ncbi:MAG: NADH-quinone oxidoreductase subunit L [Acidobacteriaceae bacterium]|nr:NADH-quinone oxidoreductase subunit L [Acidobacteriaceae bacterium]
MEFSYLWWIPLLPFAGFLINGLVGRKFPRTVVAAIALLFTAVPFGLVLKLASTMSGGGPEQISLVGAPWISVSGFTVNFAFNVDHLTLLMLLIVTGVGFLIHLYATGYMAHEEGYWRFFAYLNLFMFFMLVLVLAANFLLLFVGWEGVGLASYLLIGFYFKKDSAANAGKKAFIVNRIGDFGFLLAMFLIVAQFHTLNFTEVFGQIAAHPEWQGGMMTAIALLLVLGATGKSAQIPLYVWLPDAMEGPTPVSALIHAATMVTAGIYMVARSNVLFAHSPTALSVVAIIGALTAIFAASIGLVQNDIKRVLAYSTVSQLGYMFLACGVAAYTGAIFHLMTHAFFKALLFLAAGSVIHAIGGEQDMRAMGGLRKKIPVTFWTMTVGVIAIAGAPPLAGFFSKDEILYQTFASGHVVLWAIGLITAGMTSFYMFRLWFKTFFGEFQEPAQDAHHDDDHGHAHGVHESPAIMTIPLAILAVLSIIGGWVGIPKAFGGSMEIEHFLSPVFGEPAAVAATASHPSESGLAAVSVLVAAIGFIFAYVFYYKKPGTLGALAEKNRGLYNVLANKFYIDEIYNGLIVIPTLMFTRLFLAGFIDKGVVDGTGVTLGLTARGGGYLARKIQSGNIRSYAGWLALGAAVLLIAMTFGLKAFGATH